MSALLVSAFTPVLGSGQGLRTYAIARALAERGDLELVYAPFGAPVPASEYDRIPGLRMTRVPASRGIGRLLSYGASLAAGVPADIARGATRELLTAAAEREADAAAIVADGPVAAAALLPLARRRAAIYNAHNLESAFRHQPAAGARRGRARLERFERKLLRSFSESWMASPADLEGALRLEPGAAVRYVPNVVDVAAIEPPAPATDPDRPGLLFVGSLDYAPNRDAVRFLAAEVMPALWERKPAARLRIVGRGDAGIAPSDERIELVGFVEDLASEYAKADCVVIPLRGGGGSPLKFIEALAYGRPIVASPLAAAGLELSGEEYVRAEGAIATAAAIESVLAGEHAAMAARGRTAAERLYSIEALVGRLADDC